MDDRNNRWIDVLELLKENISLPSFETWLKCTKAKIYGNTWFVIAPNEFSRDWLESRYVQDIKDAIYQLTNESPNVEIILDEKTLDLPGKASKIDSIVKQIETLHFEERAKLFSTLKNVYGQDLQTISNVHASNRNRN